MTGGIRNLTVDQIRRRILSFNPTYAYDWKIWLTVRKDYPFEHTPPEFGRILRSWQACRPNRIRRCRSDAIHEPPYLEDIVHRGLVIARAIVEFDLGDSNTMTQAVEEALLRLWTFLKDLSYSGPSRNGLAGVVGISKAVLLLTEGRVGPAFDSKVRKELGITEIVDGRNWISMLGAVVEDIAAFERANRCTLRDTVPAEYRGLHYGRLYDMIFGPEKGLV